MLIEICVFNYIEYHVKPQLFKDSTKKANSYLHCGPKKEGLAKTRSGQPALSVSDHLHLPTSNKAI